MTDPQPDLGTDEGDTCNRLGCNGMMFDDYPYEKVICALCGYGPDNEMDDPHDD